MIRLASTITTCGIYSQTGDTTDCIESLDAGDIVIAFPDTQRLWELAYDDILIISPTGVLGWCAIVNDPTEIERVGSDNMRSHIEYLP